jgi:hypothetical protein
MNLISGVSPAGTPTHHNSSARGSPSFGDMAWQPHPTPSPKPSPCSTPTHSSQPACVALYDFDAENPAELSFKEGDTILLKSQIDENWCKSHQFFLCQMRLKSLDRFH